MKKKDDIFYGICISGLIIIIYAVYFFITLFNSGGGDGEGFAILILIIFVLPVVIVLLILVWLVIFLRRRFLVSKSKRKK